MKNLLLLIALMAGIYSVSAQGVEEYFQCVSCRSNAVNFGSYSSAIGTNNTSNGNRSFAGGFNSQATGDYSFAFGEGALSTGINTFALGKDAKAGLMHSVAIGFESEATSPSAFAIGYMNKAYAPSSYLFGENLKTLHSGAMIIGRGTSGFLINDKNNSLMIGFNSNFPTLFIGPSEGTGTTGRVGIGNITDSDYKLHILSDVDEAAEIKLEYRTTGSKQFAKIHLGDYSIRGGIDGGIQGFVFTTPSSIRHFVFQNGTLRSVNGSAAAPAYSFADNYNTGMFRQSANTLAFSTGGQERLRINSIGNVGIDTNNPTEKLQVEGFTRTSSGYKVSTETVIDANRNYTGKNGSFSGVLSVTGNANLTGNVGIGIPASVNTTLTLNKVVTSSNSYVHLIKVTGSLDNVNATKALSIKANEIDDSFLVYGSGNIRTKGNELHFDQNTTSTSTINSTVPLLFKVGDNERMIISESGNVGIGTSTPGSYKLAVAGNIRATEVQIEHIDQWYDCVFEDNYHLASLKNLEDFIKDNKHLPEIPSGKEVIEKGINVGEMNALLLKKIEELTLYVIGQQKEINALKDKLAEIENQ
ncbi:MAG TPA: hypothetical protein PLH40_06605 [Bacteroidales bacterium]|nr:hypothetical protein [Bacteroidales bacterium]